ncbi:MAG: hypothetical protein KJ981_16975 [Alphaproteobacteria bacterium]|nr:hypothetical protein [Alphaproteobacteria bacterium]MBU0834326.1 hypothetical protein [Alphaproteobacteria bacterium]MBU1765585.1 hypothetical protein [Alphaproteobacteria bacterium]
MPGAERTPPRIKTKEATNPKELQMTLKRTLAMMAMLTCGAAASPALGQSAPYPGNDDPAELFGYEIEVSETDSERVAENALRAVQRARDTAEEVKMVFGATQFRFVALKQDSMDVVAPELEKKAIRRLAPAGRRREQRFVLHGDAKRGCRRE